MSKMCSLDNKFSECSGFCMHEKMMMVIVVIAAVGASGHFLFHWF